jgi:hypothetical protein
MVGLFHRPTSQPKGDQTNNGNNPNVINSGFNFTEDDDTSTWVGNNRDTVTSSSSIAEEHGTLSAAKAERRTSSSPKQNQRPDSSNQSVATSGNGCLPFHFKPEGESDRKYFHPLEFLQICARSSSHVSSFVNILWPFVPVAIAMV